MYRRRDRLRRDVDDPLISEVLDHSDAALTLSAGRTRQCKGLQVGRDDVPNKIRRGEGHGLKVENLCIWDTFDLLD